MLLYIEIAYCSQGEGRVLGLRLEEQVTIRTVLNMHEIIFEPDQVGLRGQLVSVDQLINDQDRIEIYQPLQIDPRMKRQLLVKAKAKRK